MSEEKIEIMLLEKVSRLRALHAEYNVLYECGLTGISCEYIHVNEPLFKEITKGRNEEIKVSRNDVHIELSTVIDGTRWLTLI
jgi:hypothetical protein